MKKTSFIVLLCFLSTIVAGQIKKIAPNNSVAFKIKNAGIKVDGSFTGLKGTIAFDPNALDKSYFDVSIESKTVYTGTNARDAHLKKEEYFHVEKYPEIRFKSKKIERTKTGFVTTGSLTLKGVTKEIKIPFTYLEKDSEGLFTGSFTINRLDYGVGTSSWILSEEATIILTIKVLNTP